MAPATLHSFRYILFTRLLLTLLPLLGLGEWLVLRQARLSLLETAQQQAEDIAKFQAVSLELQQLEAATSHKACHGTKAPQTTASLPDQSCPPLSSLQLPSLSSTPTPAVAIFSSTGTLLGHSIQPSSPQISTTPLPPICEVADSSHCSLITWLQSPDFDLSQIKTAGQPHPILNDQWMIASHPLGLGDFSTSLDAASPPRTAPAPGQLVIALATEQVLAPLNRLSQWMLGTTLALTALVLVITLYWSRQLTHPAEQLRDRLLALQQQLTTANLQGPTPQTNAQEPLPWALTQGTDSPLKIHEFQQLSSALDEVLQCLNQRSNALAQATQAAHATSKLKSDFIAATSHELRTPLNAIIGHIQLIQDGYCDDAAEEKLCLSQVNNAALHLLKVLNELLDIARIEAGKFEFEQQQFELGQLLEEVLEMERSHFIQKGLTLHLRTGPDKQPNAPYWVQADRNKLKQVLLNVISNALKFTDQGSIHINLQPLCELESSKGNTAESTVVLSVTDTGIGIDPRQRQQLFRPFARAKSKAPHEGSGLGLAISRTLMERMGGEIRLYSPGLGQGTTVELHLPLQATPEPCPRHQEQRSSNATSQT